MPIIYVMSGAPVDGGGGGGGATKYDELSDTPASKTGQAGKLVKVNNAETAHEYLTNPLPTDNLLDGEMIRFDSATGQMEGTGDINADTEVDFGGKDVLCKSIVTESASVEVGPGVTISDRGGFIQSRSNVTGKEYLQLDYEVGTGGTQRPIYYSREARVIRNVTQPDDATTMTNITSYSVNPPSDQDISRVYFKLVNPVTNFRMEVISNVTGEVVKYFPSRADFERGVGISLSGGEQYVEFDSPLAEDFGYPLTVNIFADQQIDMLGDGTNLWRAVDSYDIIKENVVTIENDSMERFASEKSTKVSSGLNLTVDGVLGVATTFSISSGTLDLHDVAYTNDRSSSNVIEFDANNGVSPIFSTPTLNYVVAKSDGNVAIRFTPPTNAERRTECLIGIVVFDGVAITEIVPVKFVYQQIGNQLVDFMDAVGNLKVNDDGTITPATIGGLTLAHTDIEIFGSNINFQDPTDPHHRMYAGQDPITNMSRYLGNGLKQADSLSTIDPSNYNPSGGGVYTNLPGGANTTQIIQIWIRVDTGEPIYIPGQTDYNNISSAIADFANYRPILPEVVTVGSVKLGSIIVRSGATDLSNESDAVFVPTTKFGDVNPLAEPISDIEPTPVDNNMVYYDLALNKLVDAGIQYSAIVVGSNFTIPAGIVKCRYVVEPINNITITLPDGYNPPNANFEFEFINSRRAFGGWNEVDRIVTVTWNDGVDDYFVELTPDPLKGDQDYESYTFRFDFNEWRFTYNG